MPYAQTEISAPRHVKVSSLSHVAFRLWVVGLCYCQEHLTNGLIDARALRNFNPTDLRRGKVISELVEQGLWEPCGSHGWRVHDYLAWNHSREKVEDRHAKARARRPWPGNCFLRLLLLDYSPVPVRAGQDQADNAVDQFQLMEVDK